LRNRNGPFDDEQRRIMREKWRSEGSLDTTVNEPVWKIAGSFERRSEGVKDDAAEIKMRGRGQQEMEWHHSE
jgi:hypothetical protein